MKRLLLSVAFALATANASAHALEVATARITLRDDHVEVLAEWDLQLLVDADPTTVATQSEEALAETHKKLVARIEGETKLFVDGNTRALRLTGAPSPPELRAFAAALSAAGQTHGHLARLRLECPDPLPAPHTVALTAPSALGNVAVTFVQPASRFIGPGQSAAFTVLGAPTPPTNTSHGLLGLVGGLAVAAVLLKRWIP